MIPAEAVEAAAKALADVDPLWPDGAWETMHDELREQALGMAGVALEAAAPHIAGAWHDAVSEAYVEGALSLEQASVMWNKNPYRTPNAR